MGGHSTEPQPIPEVHFSIVDPDALLPADVDNKLAEDFGFNEGAPWTLIPSESTLSATTGDATASTSTAVAPAATVATTKSGAAAKGETRYLRWLQPMEAELATQVEYDMDEQDQVWLDGINASRKVDGSGPVSYEIFEIIVDKLEKEWFDLMKSIPKKISPLLDIDQKCAICDDGECENSNAIVFCDGCNLAVHQDCYGVPYIPEGQWLCRKCTVSPDKPVRCVLCPNSYGAFKQTTTAHWAHLLCAIWIPDTGVSNTVYMEPIDGVENISKSRWKLICYLCRQRVGACIQCANRNCFTAFHVTCARDHGLELKMKQQTGTGELRAYCEKHSGGYTPGSMTPLSSSSRDRRGRQSLGAHVPSLATSLSAVLASPRSAALSTKSQRAYKKGYSSGPPLVPSYVLDRVNAYVSKIKIANKRQFMNQLCRYWSLKREARRGAPLLKRLHLEPWTASASTRQQSDVERAKKLELMRLLREDLENVRMLTERVRKREKKKLERAQLLSRFVEEHVFAREGVMGEFIRRVSELDKHHFFAKPVSRTDAPDYYDIVHNPMDFSQMIDKLARREYPTAASLLVDFELIFDNAFLYNKKETLVHRQAVKIREASRSLVEELKRLDDPASHENILGRHLDELLTDEVVGALFEFDPATEVEEEVGGAPNASVKDVVMGVGGESMGSFEEARPGKQATTNPTNVTIEPTLVASTNEKEKNALDISAPVPPEAPVAATPKFPVEKTSTEAPKATTSKSPEGKGNRKVEVEPELVPVPEPATKATKTRAKVEGKGKEGEIEKGKQPGPEKKTGGQTPSPTKVSFSKTSSSAVPAPPTNNESLAPAPTDEGAPVKRKIGRPRKSVLPPAPEPAVDSSSDLTDQDDDDDDDDDRPIEREVEDVDDMRSFKMFETGWVLPEGSSRRAKTAVAEKEKKAAASAEERKKKEVVETSEVKGGEKSNRKDEVEGKNAKDVTVSTSTNPKSKTTANATKPTSTSKEKGKSQATETETEPDAGTVVPEVKKEKSRGSIYGTMSIASTLRRVEADGGPSGLTTASPGGSVGAGKKADLLRIAAWENKLASVEKSALVTAKTKLSDGDLVWAKSAGFPSFPAEVLGFPPLASDAPSRLRTNRPKNVEEDQMVPILFFDAYRSPRWAKREDLRLLGKNEELDAMLSSYEAGFRLILRRKMSSAHLTSLKLAEEIEEALEWANKVKAGSEQERRKARVGKVREEAGMEEKEERAEGAKEAATITSKPKSGVKKRPLEQDEERDSRATKDTNAAKTSPAAKRAKTTK